MDPVRQRALAAILQLLGVALVAGGLAAVRWWLGVIWAGSVALYVGVWLEQHELTEEE